MLHSRAPSARRLARRAAAASAAAVLAAVALSGPAVAASAPVNGGTPPYMPTQGSAARPHRAGDHHERRAYLQPSLGLLKPPGLAAGQVKMISPPATSSWNSPTVSRNH